VVVEDGRVGGPGTPGAVLASYPGAATVTRLGRLLGWDPPPLTVREARSWSRRAAPTLLLPGGAVPRATGGRPGRDDRPAKGAVGPGTAAAATVPGGRGHGHRPAGAAEAAGTPGELLVSVRDARVRLGGATILRGASLDVHEGEVVALLGRNGAGKTTLLRTVAGLLSPSSGTVERHGSVAYVPQDPDTLLFSPTVRDEVAETLRLLGRTDGGDAVERWLAALRLTGVAGRHPRSLSGGERQRVAVAAVAVGGAPVLLLDEPTRGMDGPSRDALETALRGHAAGGGAVVLATHDVELAARCATAVTVIGDGEVVASGPAREVLAGSLFAPQVLRVLPPFLTVEEVAAAIAAGAPT